MLLFLETSWIQTKNTEQDNNKVKKKEESKYQKLRAGGGEVIFQTFKNRVKNVKTEQLQMRINEFEGF